jgi:hypothetical protein
MIETITMLDFAVIAAPLTLAALALLFFGSRNIHRQMDDTVGATKVRPPTRTSPE